MAKVLHQETESGWRPWQILACAAVALILMAWAFSWRDSGAQDMGSGRALTHESPASSAAPPQTFPWHLATIGAAGDGAPAQGPVSAAADPVEWATVAQVYRKLGRSEHEAVKMVSHALYQSAYDRWQNITDPKDELQRRQLAAALVQELPKRVQDGNFSLIEAAMIGASLIAEAHPPDSPDRDQRMEQWIGEIGRLAPGLLLEQGMGLSDEAVLRRKEAAAYSQWLTATEPEQRTPAMLQETLAQARRELYEP
jgi:hypothetical protein